MKLIYTPREDAENPRAYPFDQDRMTVAEVKWLEKQSGETLQEFMELLQRGSFTNMVALFCVMRRRSESGVALTDFDDIEIGELSVEDDEPAEGATVEDEAPKDPTGSDEAST